MTKQCRVRLTAEPIYFWYPSVVPDGLGGKVLKRCSSSLIYIIQHIFELSFIKCAYPSVWKIGEIVPVGKKDIPQVDNDLRPVTLTNILSKCLERVGLDLLMPFVKDRIDPLQFVYVSNRSTEDAMITLLHRVCQHLDNKSSNTARALFLDFSSAFNTIQRHIMVDKLRELGVPQYLQLWVLDYLTNRPQYVRTQFESSSVLTLNTGAPQGCVLSPILFLLYTNALQWNSSQVFVEKYADDTVIVGLLSDDNVEEYHKCIDFVYSWHNNNYLNLNASKTKEIVWDFPKRDFELTPTCIGDDVIEMTDNYKYLGVFLDSNLSFHDHVKYVMKKAQKRLYCVRSLRKLNVDKSALLIFYCNCSNHIIICLFCSLWISPCVQRKLTDQERFFKRSLVMTLTLRSMIVFTVLVWLRKVLKL